MTAKEAYESALTLLPTNTQEDNSLERYVVNWVNLTLAEMFHAENVIRATHGGEELTAAQKVESLDDDLPCDPSLFTAVIYNLASLVCKDDDDTYWAQDYRSRFVIAQSEATPMVSGTVKDYYGGDVDA